MAITAAGAEANDRSGGTLLWLPDGTPAPGRVARLRLQNQSDIKLLEETYRAEALLPALTIYDAIRLAAAVDPDKAAIIQIQAADGSLPARAVTYAELIDQITRAANVFFAASAGAPVSVATILPMIPEALIAVWGASAAGLAVPINPYLEPDYIVAILNTARTTVLVTSVDAWRSGGREEITRIRDAVPSIRRILIVGSQCANDAFESALAEVPGELVFQPVCDPDACATYQLTGGTTAAPKLCQLTHRGQLINAWLNGALQGTSVDGAVGHAMPNFHIGGATVIALRTILFSQTLVTLTHDGFRNLEVVQHFWDIARRHRMTAVLATPTTAAAMLAATRADPAGHNIEAFACGGSTVPIAMNRAFHARFGVWLREQWGFSEAQGTVTGHFLDGHEPVNGSIGYAFPYYRVSAVEVDDKNRFVRECAPGERGVLAVRGPISPGYVDTSLDGGLFIEGMPGGARWANSGDLGSVDEHGYVWLFGRAKDLIVRGGHNIDPKLIEDVLMAHPAVQIAAAIGRPDAAKGEMPIAYVQLKQGVTADSAELIQFCRVHGQERASVPVEIHLVEEMPTTPVGKVSKPALRRDALRRCVHSIATTVIGHRGEFRFEVDDTGSRPCVRLYVADEAMAVDDLERAFLPFEFATRIERM